MAVVILNITEDEGGVYGKSEQTYSLRINYRELCRFKHNFEDGLVKCLRNAADAFEKLEEE